MQEAITTLIQHLLHEYMMEKSIPELAIIRKDSSANEVVFDSFIPDTNYLAIKTTDE